MRLTRLVLVAVAAAGAAHYLKGRGLPGLPGTRKRLSLGGGMGAAAPEAPPVAETMWTPADPAADRAASGTAAASI